jgi:Zn-dependent M28 family amino/carboxypeptidase
MRQRTDSVIVQTWVQTTKSGQKLRLQNVLARFNPGAANRVLYVTHWDTRPVADEDPNFGNRARPVLGANDGAAGVGFFLALGDVFKQNPPSVGVDLLFTDGEDWGSFDPDSTGKVWPDALFGSQYFAQHPPSPSYQPLFGVLFDMIGATDLHLWQEPNSLARAPEVVHRVWATADSLGYGAYFHDAPGVTITDDQVPLLNRGWHVMDLVDWPYGVVPAGAGPEATPNPNYHHTVADTFDKLSARSLQIVGDIAVTLVK